MANTKIQIKRSQVTNTPSSLDIGELAYSYSSNTLFIGTVDGTGALAIAGSASSSSANNYANAVGAAANAYAQAVGSAGNAYADVVGSSANNYAGVMANSANAYTSATYLPLTGGTLSGDLNINANLTVTGLTTYVNTATLLVSDNIFVLNSDLTNSTAPTQDAGMEINRGSSANVSILWNETDNLWTFTNDGTNYRKIASNTDIEAGNTYAQAVGTAGNAYAAVVGTSANAYADTVGTAANAYASAVGTSANAYAAGVGTSANVYAAAVGTSANAYAAIVGTSANAYADVVGGAANTNAANGSYISTGIVKVPYGGTGVTSFTQNGIVFGNTSGDLKVTTAGTEGQILQASATGVPQFGMLDGGSF